MGPSGNLILDSLNPRSLATLSPLASDQPIATVLITADEIPEFIYFPHRNAVVSIIRSTADGFGVEAGVVGSEGLFSLQSAITRPAPTGSVALVQNEGQFTRTGAVALRALFGTEATFRGRVLAYTSLFLEQLTQNLLCNRLHPIEQRLAKWLLIIRDRISSDELHLTQEFLAHMLGIHRPGVSIAMTTLELDGVVLHARNRITVRDLAGLRDRSCECYGVVHTGLENYRATFAA